MTRSLLSAREDAERRDRGISLERWIRAPKVPPTRGDCEDGPRPCPHLRCRHHNGERGDRSHSCALDPLPDDERTLERIAEIRGDTASNVQQIERNALTKAWALAPRDVLIELRIRKR